MKGYRSLTVAVLATTLIGVGARQFLCPHGDAPENARAATFAGCPCGDAAPRPESAPSTRAPAAKRQVVVKSNDQCYVCHMPFLKEGLAAVHAKVHVWCGTCHGPSIRHIQDEYIGATPPDAVFKKQKIDRMCGQCHDPGEHSILPRKVRRARLAESKKAQQRIKGPKVKVSGVCTDCHGRHWIRPRDQEKPLRESDANPGTGATSRP